MRYKTKSAEQKKAEGTFRPDRDTFNGLIVPNVSDIKPPTRLNKDAKKFWNDNIQLLSEAGLLKQTDLMSFEITCSSWSDYIFYSQLMETEKALPTPNFEKINKLQRMKTNLSKQVFDFFSKFGTNPLDRQKIQQPIEEEVNEWEDL